MNFMRSFWLLLPKTEEKAKEKNKRIRVEKLVRAQDCLCQVLSLLKIEVFDCLFRVFISQNNQIQNICVSVCWSQTLFIPPLPG